MGWSISPLAANAVNMSSNRNIDSSYFDEKISSSIKKSIQTTELHAKILNERNIISVAMS